MDNNIARIAWRIEALAAELDGSEHKTGASGAEPERHGETTMPAASHWMTSLMTGAPTAPPDLSPIGDALEHALVGVARRMHALEGRVSAVESHRLAAAVAPPDPIPLSKASGAANAGASDVVASISEAVVAALAPCLEVPEAIETLRSRLEALHFRVGRLETPSQPTQLIESARQTSEQLEQLTQRVETSAIAIGELLTISAEHSARLADVAQGAQLFEDGRRTNAQLDLLAQRVEDTALSIGELRSVSLELSERLADVVSARLTDGARSTQLLEHASRTDEHLEQLARRVEDAARAIGELRGDAAQVSERLADVAQVLGASRHAEQEAARRAEETALSIGTLHSVSAEMSERLADVAQVLEASRHADQQLALRVEETALSIGALHSVSTEVSERLTEIASARLTDGTQSTQLLERAGRTDEHLEQLAGRVEDAARIIGELRGDAAQVSERLAEVAETIHSRIEGPGGSDVRDGAGVDTALQQLAGAVAGISDRLELLSLRVEQTAGAAAHDSGRDPGPVLETLSDSLERLAGLDAKLDATQLQLRELTSLTGETLVRLDVLELAGVNAAAAVSSELAAEELTCATEPEVEEIHVTDPLDPAHLLDGLPFDSSESSEQRAPERRHLFWRV